MFGGTVVHVKLLHVCQCTSYANPQAFALPWPHRHMQIAVPKGQLRRNFLLVSLVNTGAMWGFTGNASDQDMVIPFMAATIAGRGSPVAAPPAGSMLQQPEGAPGLSVSNLPAGFWAGRVSLLRVKSHCCRFLQWRLSLGHEDIIHRCRSLLFGWDHDNRACLWVIR